MSEIIDALKVSGEKDLGEAKMDHWEPYDPDFAKVNIHSEEDLLTQLAKIKGLNPADIEKELEQRAIISYLEEKHYQELQRILCSKNLTADDKRSIFGKGHRSYFVNRVATILLTLLIVTASIVAYFALLPLGSMFVCCLFLMIYGALCVFRSPITDGFHHKLNVFYFNLMKFGR